MDDNVESKNKDQNKRKYPLPELKSTMPFHENPLYHDVVKLAIDWHYETCQLTRKQYRRVESCTLFIAYFYPFCKDKPRFEILIRLMLNVFIIDDHLELTYGDMNYDLRRTSDILSQMHSVHEKIYPIFKNHQSSSYWKQIPSYKWKPYIYALNALIDNIMLSYNDIQKQRFIETFNNWIDGMWEEAIIQNEGQNFDDVETFIKIRIKSFGIEMMIQLIEFSYDIFVPEADWQNKNIKKFISLSNRLCMYVNDTYSFEKELMDANNQLSAVHNLTAITARMENLDIQKALIKTALKINEIETQIYQTKNKLLANALLSPDTRLFIDHICYLNGGNWKASTLIERYNKLITPKACNDALD